MSNEFLDLRVNGKRGSHFAVMDPKELVWFVDGNRLQISAEIGPGLPVTIILTCEPSGGNKRKYGVVQNIEDLSDADDELTNFARMVMAVFDVPIKVGLVAPDEALADFDRRFEAQGDTGVELTDEWKESLLVGEPFCPRCRSKRLPRTMQDGQTAKAECLGCGLLWMLG